MNIYEKEHFSGAIAHNFILDKQIENKLIVLMLGKLQHSEYILGNKSI